MRSNNDKKIAGLLVLVVGFLWLLYGVSQSNEPQVEVKYASVFFESSAQDNSIFNVQYIVGVKNLDSKPQSFQLTIKPKDLEWYPYLHCIPESFTTRVVTLMGNDGDLIELNTRYQSTEQRSTSGYLGVDELEVVLIGAE